jgi:multicomponent Na+:H+ antiporter subunit B
MIANNRPGPGGLDDNGTGMSMIVKTVTRWLKGPILLFGIYIVLYGHITPGGGFGGGVIIACAFILITLALGEKNGLDIFSKALASRLDSGGLLIFLLVGWLGTYLAAGWVGGYFFENFITTPEQSYFALLSAGTMPVLNIALGLKVASALFLVFTVLTALRITQGGIDVEENPEEDGP